MMRRCTTVAAACVLIVGGVVWSAAASDARLYFSSDRNGQDRVTSIQEGDSVWIVVHDPDENIDCDARDKFWTDVKLMDPKTGANVDWESWEDDADIDPYDYVGRDGSTAHGHFFEETGADTGVFVSNVPFRIGRRIDWEIERGHTHWVGFDFDGFSLDNVFINDFLGDWYYFWPGLRGVFDLPIDPEYAPFVGVLLDPFPHSFGPFHGWFENMDTLVGLFQDPNDPSDVAIAMMKIVDTEATISWDHEVYEDANTAATLTVVDADENLDGHHVESVPVFVLVNPGSWNPLQDDSPTTFCMLWRVGGVVDLAGNLYDLGIWPWNIYDSGLNAIDLAGNGSNQPNADGTWYVDYPTEGDDNVVWFDTASESGVTRVMFYAHETGPDTGVFQLNLNSLLTDLGFDDLRVRDVLAAYYLDPNDFDDFKVAAAYIEEHRHSAVSFTDAARAPRSTYWIGRDPIYVEVVDANANVDPCCPERVVVHLCTPHEEDDSEWWILDEVSSNSPAFFSDAGMRLEPLWNATGVNSVGAFGGYQLELDNWTFEAFNEDDVLVRYNDVYYASADRNDLGDVNIDTAFPPEIDRVRVANDVSFDLMSIGDTQVFDGETTRMRFLDRQGSPVSGYVNSDCVFIEVIDPDQNEDPRRRERIDGYWADVLNAWPFAPEATAGWDCGPEEGAGGHLVNDHLGTVSIFNTLCGPKVYVLNPRNGYWAAVDLFETGAETGQFVSTICLDLADVHACVPTLGALPGDTILAVYQDPSNHSDSAWISIQVGIGGAGTGPGQASTTTFVDEEGVEVAAYTNDDLVYVQVVDPSQSGAVLAGALTIEGDTFELVAVQGEPGLYRTEGLDLGLAAGDEITATYTDPKDPTDTSSDTIPIVASALDVVEFYAAPSPFETECTFGYRGTGTATVMSVDVYDLTGTPVWSAERTDAREIVWDGTTGARCESVANGAYVYVIHATDGTNTFTGKGKVFVHR
jgi:hypothetical protein